MVVHSLECVLQLQQFKVIGLYPMVVLHYRKTFWLVPRKILNVCSQPIAISLQRLWGNLLKYNTDSY